MIQPHDSGRAEHSQVRDGTTGALDGPVAEDTRYIIRRRRQYPERWLAMPCQVALDARGRAAHDAL